MVILAMGAALIIGLVLGYQQGRSAPPSFRSRSIGLVDWLHQGVTEGYCSAVYCDTHDVLMTSAESSRFEAGEDPCIPVVRVYER